MFARLWNRMARKREARVLEKKWGRVMCSNLTKRRIDSCRVLRSAAMGRSILNLAGRTATFLLMRQGNRQARKLLHLCEWWICRKRFVFGGQFLVSALMLCLAATERLNKTALKWFAIKGDE